MANAIYIHIFFLCLNFGFHPLRALLSHFSSSVSFIPFGVHVCVCRAKSTRAFQNAIRHPFASLIFHVLKVFTPLFHAATDIDSLAIQ